MKTRVEYRAVWTNSYNRHVNGNLPLYTGPVAAATTEALRGVYPFNVAEEEMPQLLGWQCRMVTESDWEDR